MFLQNFLYKKTALTVLLLLTGFTMLAQDAAAKPVTSGTNLLAVLLTTTIALLAFVIWALGQVLVALSQQLAGKNKPVSKTAAVALLVTLSMLSQTVWAQAAADPVTPVLPNYGGLSANTFYLLMAVVLTEIFAVFFLYFSIRRINAELLPEKAAAAFKDSRFSSLWIRLGKKFFSNAIPLEQEADALLDHNYDGIQELDNALPPWWKYGFIITIGFAFVYLLNFHVFGNGKNPTEEYQAEMENAKLEKEAYESKNKDRIDEAHVPMVDAAGIQSGQVNFLANCVACHGAKGEGGVGPNLTDNYWLHKGSLNDIYNTIKKGYPDKGMQSWATKFSPKEMSQLAGYIATLKGTNPPNGKAQQGDLFTETGITDSLTTSGSATITKADSAKAK